jgi:coenzyme F420-dependent glucose-6-phosphate dehydrogenase
VPEFGYALSSEEHHPNDLVRYAQWAEEAGFSFAMVSDHYHPWIDQQGHSPFVWNVIGAIANATERLRLGTGVVCPTIRIHPAIIAQAAATSAAMMPGRFMLGLGTGENLNEHITGYRWPPHDVRLEMLEEAVSIIRLLWEGDSQSYWGTYFVVENARIYTLPEELPPILIAAGGTKTAEVAGRIGDGLVSTAPKEDLLDEFDRGGGAGKPRYGQVTVCWDEDEEEARRIAHKWWPTSGLPGELTQELPMPAHFEQAVQLVDEETVTEKIVCGPDADRHIQAIQKFVDAGFDHIYVHQVGPKQEDFFRFYADQVLPSLQ